MRYAWLAILGFLLACCAIVTFEFWRVTGRVGTHLSDFTVFWTAARFPHPYDVVGLTDAQLWRIPPHSDLRPFPYPPTGLLLIKPLALFSFYAGAIVWTGVGLSALVAGSFLYGRRALVGVANPAVWFSLATGQMSLILGGAVAGGVALLETSPVLAGSLLGAAWAVKPTFAVLAPVALVAGGHWRAMTAWLGIVVALICASLLAGPHLWADWYQSLGYFAARVHRGFWMNASPGLQFAPVGVVGVAYVFRKWRSPPVRLLALVVGSLLCVPYAMIYDLAAISPAIGLLLLPLTAPYKPAFLQRSTPPLPSS